MPAEVVDNVPLADVDAVRTGLMTGSALRMMQKRNPDGTYRLTVFREHVNDLFISYATEDLDLCVRDLVQNLWRCGVTAIWWDRMSIDVRESIPRKVDEGLRQSKYILCVLTEAYFGKFWTREELGAVTMQKKQIIPIWIDTTFEAVSAFSPILASKKAIVYDGDAHSAMATVAKILGKDADTQFHHNADSRQERELFWGITWLYIKHCLGILDRSTDREFQKIGSAEPWKAHVERELGVGRKKVQAMAAEFKGYTAEEQAHLVLAVLKRASDGWFPTYDIELELLRKSGLSDW